MTPRTGIALKVASVLGFTLMSACVKAAAEAVPIGQVCFFRSFFALIPVIALFAWRGEFPAAIFTSNPWGHAWRGGLGLLTMVLNFTAFWLLPMSDAIAIGYAAPLLVTAFAAIFLGEIVRIYRWTAVVIGIVGVLIILWPRLAFLKGEGDGAPAEQIGALCALLSTVVMALISVIMRKLIVGERTSTITLYFSVICSLGALLTAPFGWTWPDGWTLAVLILSGLFGGIAQILVTESYRHAENSAIAPFEYTSIVFGIVLGLVLFGDVPTATMLVGAAVVIAAGLFVIWREHRLEIDHPPPSAWPWAMLGVERHEE